MLLQRQNIKESGNVDEGVIEDQIVRDKYDKILLCEVETDVTQTYDSLLLHRVLYVGDYCSMSQYCHNRYGIT